METMKQIWTTDDSTTRWKPPDGWN